MREGHRAAGPAAEGFAQNQVWCEIVALACELIAWTQLLALAGAARRWEPKRLRLRVFAVAGRLASGGRGCGSGWPNALGLATADLPVTRLLRHRPQYEAPAQHRFPGLSHVPGLPQSGTPSPKG